MPQLLYIPITLFVSYSLSLYIYIYYIYIIWRINPSISQLSLVKSQWYPYLFQLKFTCSDGNPNVFAKSQFFDGENIGVSPMVSIVRPHGTAPGIFAIRSEITSHSSCRRYELATFVTIASKDFKTSYLGAVNTEALYGGKSWYEHGDISWGYKQQMEENWGQDINDCYHLISSEIIQRIERWLMSIMGR